MHTTTVAHAPLTQTFDNKNIIYISSCFNIVPFFGSSFWLLFFFFILFFSSFQEIRVRNVGGFVVMGRVMGKLAVSRAIGDSEFKRKNGRMMTEFNITGPLVIPDPDVTCTGKYFFFLVFSQGRKKEFRTKGEKTLIFYVCSHTVLSFDLFNPSLLSPFFQHHK